MNQTLPPWGETKVVGKPLPRVDAYECVSGSAVYTIDVSLPGMLHAATLRCPHAHALVKRVDARAAKGMPGVHAVLTNEDPEGQIVVPYPWWIPDGPPMRLFDPHCRFAGEEVAAVAAETPYQAREALRAIAVEYQELPFVLDAEAALKPGAPAVHGNNVVGPASVSERGDLTKGFAEADVVLEQTYATSCEIHATAEVHGTVARWDGDRLTVWESSQGVFDLQEDLARVLGLPLSSVRVICHYMGGGFGGKAELGKYALLAVLLARKTARPVKAVLSREEAFLCVGNRPPITMTFKAGARKDGTLTAFQFSSVGTIGAYRELADNVSWPVASLYRCPNVRTQQTQVYIHAGKGRSMRAPGSPQCSWALEQMMDALAEKLGMDPVDFRVKNITLGVQAPPYPYTSTGLKQCLIEGAAAFGWREARARPRRQGHTLRGVGVAAGMWGGASLPPAPVVLKLFADGSLNLNMGVSDLGTGAKTVLAMAAAEELGIPLSRIGIEYADTATTQYAQVSGGSHTTINNAPAVRVAAAEIRRQLLEIAADQLKCPTAELILEDGRVFRNSESGKGVPLAELKGLAQRRVIVAVGNPPRLARSKMPGPPYGAHFAEVEVNSRTGEVRLVRFLAAHDSGRVMNLLTYQNQVFGGVTMGIGFGLAEQRRLDRQTGRVLNANLHDYKVPTALDVPADMTCLPVDPHDTECNNTGTKGLGEPATIPTAPAIANAVYHATGIRVTQAPITPMQLLELRR